MTGGMAEADGIIGSGGMAESGAAAGCGAAMAGILGCAVAPSAISLALPVKGVTFASELPRSVPAIAGRDAAASAALTASLLSIGVGDASERGCAAKLTGGMVETAEGAEDGCTGVTGGILVPSAAASRLRRSSSGSRTPTGGIVSVFT